MAVAGRSARELFGHPDFSKIRSCLTLFAATRASAIYQQALARYFDGVPDALMAEALYRSQAPQTTITAPSLNAQVSAIRVS